MSEGDLERIARDPGHLALIRRVRYRSAMVLPLTARGRTAGVLSLVRFGADAPPFDEDDLALGLDVARRAALAYDNACLYEELRVTQSRLEAILANVGEAVSAFAPDGTFVFTNQAAVELAGARSAAELMEAGVEALLERWIFLDEHGHDVAVDDLPLARGLRGEDPEPLLLRAVERATGRHRWLRNRAGKVLDEHGMLQLVVHVSEDVTAARQQEARERLLSNASKLLASSLDVAATLDKTAWAVVPELADWVRVDLPDERGVPRQAAVAHRDLEKLDLLHEWRRHFPPAPDDTRGPAEVLRTGRPVVWDSVDPEDVVRYAQSARHAELMRAIDTRSIIIVPLRAGDRVIGTIELATTSESGRLLGPHELDLAEELARRAAIAVENARLHEARTHIAVTLQRSLLPPRLPVIPGLAIAARFRAAGVATEVGGDFYDLFEGRGRWMVMMGDVTGKGPAAAAITSLARFTMRTAAQYEDDACAMLERLNAALAADQERRQICTAVCVGVPHDRDGAAARPVRVEIVCAGHPSPLLVGADGTVTEVGCPGTGAFPDGRWTATDVELRDGSALVLYTDGVTDTRGAAGRFGFERLEALLRDIGPAPVDLIAHRIDEALVAFGEQRDDVALLVMAPQPAPGDQATLVGWGSGRDG
jgi:PAS domain S-box-containing protein